MTKLAEQFIKDYTRSISNELDFKSQDGTPEYAYWLTPEEARAACIIEREETINKACEWLSEHLSLSLFVTYQDEDIIENIEISDFVKNFRKAMEGE